MFWSSINKYIKLKFYSSYIWLVYTSMLEPLFNLNIMLSFIRYNVCLVSKFSSPSKGKSPKSVFWGLFSYIQLFRIAPRKHGNLYLLIISQVTDATKPDAKESTLERGGGRRKGAASLWLSRHWGGQKNERTRQGDQGGPSEGRLRRATKKKILPVRREGVKSRAVVQGKGEEGRTDIPRRETFTI